MRLRHIPGAEGCLQESQSKEGKKFSARKQGQGINDPTYSVKRTYLKSIASMWIYNTPIVLISRLAHFHPSLTLQKARYCKFICIKVVVVVMYGIMQCSIMGM